MIRHFARPYPMASIYSSEEQRIEGIQKIYKLFCTDKAKFKIVGNEENDYMLLIEFSDTHKTLVYLTPALREYIKIEREEENVE